MHRVAVALAFGATACPAEVGPPQNVREPTLVAHADSVAVEGAELTFSPTNVRLPSSLKVGSTEVLRQGTCPDPALAGVAIAPFEFAVGGQDPNVATAMNTLELLPESGPAMAKYKVEYGVGYDCGGQQVLRGTSTFTIFPSGRIVRNDVVSPVSTNVADASGCIICGGARTATAFESFWSFNGRRLEVVGGLDVETTVKKSVAEACAQTGGATVALRWADGGSFPSDVANGVSFSNEQAVAGVGLTVGSVSATSVIAVGQGECNKLLPSTLTHALELADMINTEPLVADPVTQVFSLATPFNKGHFEVRGVNYAAVPGDFAVQLDLGDGIEHMEVRMRNGGPAVFTVQDVNARPTLIWFQGPLEEGDAYQIFVL